MAVIERDTVMRDRRGVDWSPSPDYQDGDVDGPHWLELRSEQGEVASFREVCDVYGMTNNEGVAYLDVIRR